MMRSACHLRLCLLLLAAVLWVVVGAQGQVAGPGVAASLSNSFATVQRDGKPYTPFYTYYVSPHAMVEEGRVFCAYQDGDGRPIAMAYDIAGKEWSGPVRASDHGLGEDMHGNPSICIDGKGRLHVFFGCHGREMYHVRSAKPYDIGEWQEASSPAERATYPESMRMADGRMFLFYRAGGHMEPWSLKVSTDDGETWSEAEKIVEMRLAPPDRLAAAYCTFLPGAKGETVHGFFVHKDDNPGRNPDKPHPWRPVKYPGLHEAVYRYNIYYIRRDADGAWKGADGAALELPLSKAAADEHALVYDSGDEFAGPRRIVIDGDNRPYLRFMVGVTDWKSGEVMVPREDHFAAPGRDGWRTSGDLPADWPDSVRQHVMLPGPAAYGTEFPNPWFVHFKKGPKQDARVTCIWLGHMDRGYAARRGGPAGAPEN